VLVDDIREVNVNVSKLEDRVTPAVNDVAEFALYTPEVSYESNAAYKLADDPATKLSYLSRRSTENENVLPTV